MTTKYCPTGRKRKYPSKDLAEARAVVQSIQTYPYQCECGFWHLTMRRAVAPTVGNDLVEELAGLPDDRFASHVTAELRGRATPEIAAALRHKKIWHRWLIFLRAEQTRLHADMAKKKGINDDETKQWRAAVIRRGGIIQGRQLEIDALRDARRQEVEGRRISSSETLRDQARKTARRRLVHAHLDEYVTLLAEEIEARGLPLAWDE